MCLLGLDIGSSGCKATIINGDGTVLGQGAMGYAAYAPLPGYIEMDPNDVWTSVKQAIVQALSHYKGEPIRAIGVSSFGEAVVPLDADGRVLANSLMYTDIRGRDEALILERALGDERIYKITGCSVHPMYAICKIMWMKRHEQEVYSRVWKFLAFADFILLRLGAGAYTDYSLAARTMAFDVVGKRWSEAILQLAGIEPGLFGEPVQGGTAVGTIEPRIAAELGLPPNTMLVAGGHDQTCAALGAGILRSGSAVDGLGTTECLTPVFDRPILTPQMANSGFACVPHVLPDRYVTYGFIFTSGSMLKWYLEQWGQSIAEEAARTSRNKYELLLRQASPDPSKLFVLPHFAGAATPYMDLDAKGAIVGLDVQTTAAELIKGILEGITLEMMVNVERMQQTGIVIQELRAVGGLANSELYLQLKADMMGIPVSSLHVGEAGTLGVAILAGKASGLFQTYEDAVGKLVAVKETYDPHSDRRALYVEKFDHYKRLYPALKVWRNEA